MKPSTKLIKPKQLFSSILEEVKVDSKGSTSDKLDTEVINMTGAQVKAFLQAEIADSVRDSLHQLFTQILQSFSITDDTSHE